MSFYLLQSRRCSKSLLSSIWQSNRYSKQSKNLVCMHEVCDEKILNVPKSLHSRSILGRNSHLLQTSTV